MTRSMTGFAARQGALDTWSWTWDMRSVNGRGLDIRLRIPDWIEGLENKARAAIQGSANRGNITLTLRVTRADSTEGAALNAAVLEKSLEQLSEISKSAEAAGFSLAPLNAADILALRGVQDHSETARDIEPLKKALIGDLGELVDAFTAMRDQEGDALADILGTQIDTIENLVGKARALEPARTTHLKKLLNDNLQRVLENSDGADPERVAQELALISVKADVAEELDRLNAHIQAARGLIAEEGAKGRKLDFLTQEFNREANTLCAKAQFSDLTSIGLELKSVIDQMREQVQNVE